MRSSLSVPLLIADDDPNDMFLFTRLLKGGGAVNPLHVALNGQEAVEFLERWEKSNGLIERPGAVFLDIRMPKLTGLEVLTWVRARTVFDRLPIIVLSGADEPAEIARARTTGAQCYLKKYPSASVIVQVLELASRFAERGENPVFPVPANLLWKEGRESPQKAAG